MSDTNVNLALAGRSIPADGIMVGLLENYNKFLVDLQLKQPNVLRDLIPKGVYQLFNGYEQKRNIYRGVLGPQTGLSEWEDVAPSSKTLNIDACTMNPQTYSWAYDSLVIKGMRTWWRSPVICVEEMKHQYMAREQLGMIINSGFTITDAVQETFNRETLIAWAVRNGKAMIMCDGGLEYLTSSAVRFSYDPFTKVSGEYVLTFPKVLLDRMSTLNFDFMDYFRTYVSNQAPAAALAMDSGMIKYGALLDLIDWEKMVKSDSAMREDLRFSQPSVLLDGYSMGFKEYRGALLMHDPRQARFVVDHISGANVVCPRVEPMIATRDGTIGKIPEVNPAYMTAELGTVIFILKNVLTIEVPEVVTALGDLKFGPAPAYNGEWMLINNKDNDKNVIGDKAYLLSRFEYYPTPGDYAQEITVALYKRCPGAFAITCKNTLDSDTVTSAGLASAPVAGDFSGTEFSVTLTLAGRLSGGDVGKKVTVKNDAGAEFTAYIAEAAHAPTYKLVWTDGDTNVPSAVTEIDGVTTVTIA